jgi:putative ABC transport system permease protein
MTFYLTALVSGLCLSLMALGIFISMKIFRIPDITTDGSYTLGAVVTAIVLTQHWPVAITIPVVIIAGAIAGALTGIIHTRFKIDALLAGILVMTGLYSINLSLLGRSNLPLLDISGIFNWITETTVTDLLICIVFTGVIMLIIGYILKTDFGIAMRATGNSPSMSKALGINVNRMKIMGLSIANALTALSGFLMSQYQGFTDINMGIGIVIVGLGSVLIGDALVSLLKVSRLWLQLVAVMVGSVLFQLVLAFTLSIGVDPNLLKLVTAVFVLAIVAIPALKLKRTA